MFDIGGWEFLLIAILGIIIIGPKELPGAIRTVSIFVRRARELARDFQSGLEDVAREAELDKLGEDLVGPSAGFAKNLKTPSTRMVISVNPWITTQIGVTTR